MKEEITQLIQEAERVEAIRIMTPVEWLRWQNERIEALEEWSRWQSGRIEELEREALKYRTEAGQERELSEDIVGEREQLYIRVEELEKENERYRIALKRITVTFDKMPMVEIARKALKGDPK